MEDEQILFVKADSEENTTGYPYDLYVPDVVNENTPVHLSFSRAAAEEYLRQNGSNSIVIMPVLDSIGTGDEKKYARQMLAISDSVIEKYGVNANNVSISGWSNGGKKAIYTSLFSYNDEYKTKITQAVNLDGSCSLNRELMDEMIKNNIIVYSVPGRINDASFAEKYAKFGGIAIRIDTNKLGHSDINKGAFKNGLIDFLGSNGDLSNNDSVYKYSMFNINSNQWEEISYEELKKIVATQNGNAEQVEGSIIGTNEISIDTVKSDDDVLQGYIDKIHRNMESTRSTPFTPEQYVSTAATPNNNSKVVARFFQATEKLLHNLASDTNYVLTVGSKLQEMDKNLSERVKGLAEPPALPSGDPGGDPGGDSEDTATKKHTFGEVASNIGKSGVTGAIIGSAINLGLGTAIGFGIGAVVGTVATYWQEIVGFFKGLGTKKDSDSEVQSTPAPGPTPSTTPAPTPTAAPEPTIAPGPTPVPDVLGTE